MASEDWNSRESLASDTPACSIHCNDLEAVACTRYEVRDGLTRRRVVTAVGWKKGANEAVFPH